ncbi:Peptidyl-tRNA hydrolase [Candidatus Terasakiella magnetica]|uniref:Peptidyl-tRNA hydrolase n=1 Tax=Candidatus Terasakiella magnetica TaxID=1867952 RepID=A0A1C3RE49_9PROT|nr:aminoacyl-tRNA hydrolase [Candidatus Terasakiella magnetica]SCA55563.1 Peptidyl-tRNA hydrolase [Candidatus Terasakiella magnetica]
MILLVGLGNPGGKYAKNRHNIGFMALDTIVRRHCFGPWRTKFQGQMCEGTIDGVKVLALMPETFMNESGRSIGAAARFYKIDPENIIVMHDELDLAFTKIKVKTGGGHGGHNGLRSTDAHMGKNYKRVRLGIGHPGSKEKVHSHVLGDFAKAEVPELDKMLDTVCQHIGLIANGEDTDFMNRYALDMRPQRPNKAKPKEKTVQAKEKPAPSASDEANPFAVLQKLKD